MAFKGLLPDTGFRNLLADAPGRTRKSEFDYVVTAATQALTEEVKPPIAWRTLVGGFWPTRDNMLLRLIGISAISTLLPAFKASIPAV